MILTLELIQQILQVIILPLLGYFVTQLIGWLQVKKEDAIKQIENTTQKKYLDMLKDTIEDCVIATNQTYVNRLKKENSFTPEAQREAFNLTFQAVLNILTEEAQFYLNEILDDLEAYIKMQIEASVNINKQ